MATPTVRPCPTPAPDDAQALYVLPPAPPRAARAPEAQARGARREAPQAPTLENPANRCATAGQGYGPKWVPTTTGPDEARQVHRAERHEVRHFMRRWTTLDRVRSCGWTAVNDGGVIVRLAGGGSDARAGLAGVSTCGSVWSCPVCAEKIQARRREEILSLITAAEAKGCSVVLVTLTMRHNAGDRLADLWDDLSGAWAAVNRDGTYRRHRDLYGQVGWLRAVETTRGDNGWHVHIHALIVVEGRCSQDRAELLGELLWAPWHRHLSARPGREPVREAFDVRVGRGALAAMGEYLVKSTYDGDDLTRAQLAELYRGSYEGLASEVTLSTHKRGRRGSRTPFEILRDVQASAGTLATDDGALTAAAADDAALWVEWEQASHRRRQLTWSKGLREWAGLDAEEDADEEIAAEDLAGDDVVILPPDTWRAVRRHAWVLLDLAENGGRDALTSWLDLRQLDWLDARLSAPPTHRRSWRQTA